MRYRIEFSRKNPFPRAQGRGGHPEEGVRKPSRKGFCHEQGDLRYRVGVTKSEGIRSVRKVGFIRVREREKYNSFQ
jgi:hypothetical protein